ncbi:MAG TPA: EpsG family protein, partial [Prevotellaceae bacterium]|nr:EpsG family protein [Prevotellaceae bacterium]
YQKYVSRIFFFSLCWLVLHDGLRWFIATDWDVYYRFFRYCLLVKGDAVYFEPGYVLLNKIVRTVTDQYTVFLLLHAVIVYSLIGSTIYKYAAYPLLSLALLYAMMLGYLGMNRQYIA